MTAYIFTVENVLADPGERINDDFKRRFLSWQETHKTYLLSEESKDSVIEMLGEEICSNAEMILAHYSNEVWRGNDLLHRAIWNPEQSLVDYLLAKQVTPLAIRAGVGEIEFLYPTSEDEKIKFILEASGLFPELDFVIKGKNSIAIYPNSCDKRQALDWIEEDHVVFFGHKTLPGGDDYPLAVSIGLVHRVEDWQHTWELLDLTF